MDKLLIAVMGNRNSGKSHTWNELFLRTVKTGTKNRELHLNESEYVNVFLVSGSPEERGEYVEDIITVDDPRIVLCSVQYREDATETLNYFFNEGYSIYIHWLNPGFSDDPIIHYDSHGIVPYLLSKNAMFGIRDGQKDATDRVNEVKDCIFGWAKSRNLIKTVR